MIWWRIQTDIAVIGWMGKSNTCISHCRGIPLWHCSLLPRSPDCSPLTDLQERNHLWRVKMFVLRPFTSWKSARDSPWMTLMWVWVTTSADHIPPISTPHMYHPESASLRLFMVTLNKSWSLWSEMLTLSSAGLAERGPSVRARLVQNSLVFPRHQYFTWLAYWGS